MEKVRELQERYLNQLVEITDEARRFRDKPPLVLLSGGTDSFVLLALAVRQYGTVKAMTIMGDQETKDIRLAREAAKMFDVPLDIVRISFEDILANLQLVRGTNLRSPYSLQFIIVHNLAFSRYDIREYDVLQGDGADSLYGSTGPFTYKEVPDLMRKHGWTTDEARTFCKQRYFHEGIRIGRGDGNRFIALVEKFGGNPIQPYRSEQVRWVNDLPWSIVRPHTKGFIRDALRDVWNVDAGAPRRIAMQLGSGQYQTLKALLPELAGTATWHSALKVLTANE